MSVNFLRKPNDPLFYFQILDDDQQAILDSIGYENQGQCGEDANWTLEHYKDEDYYLVRAQNGQYIFSVQNADQQTIASSRAFANQAALKAIFPFIDNVKTVAGTPYQGAKGGDDYEPLSFYQSNIAGVENGFDAFSTDKGHYFTYNLNGQIILISESYTSTGGRDNGIASVEKNLAIDARYQRRIHPNGKHYFNLLAGNNQEIATSVWFDTEQDLSIVIGALSGTASGEVTIEMIEGEVQTDFVAANKAASIGIAAAPPTEVATDKPKKKRKKRRKVAKPKAEKVIVAEDKYLFNDINYQIFRSGNGRYYYTFKNTEGKTVLMNSDVRGFETQEQAQAVVDKVLKFGPFEKNFEGKTTKNGKYYFYLKDEDGKNIGKSFFFDSTESLQQSVGFFLGTEVVNQAALAAARLKAAEEEAKLRAAEEARLAAEAEEAKRKEEESKKKALRTDDYLPCKAYAGENDFHTFQNEESKEYYFAYNRDGKTLLRSEGYTTAAARDNGIESVKKNAPLEERWSQMTAMNDKYHFYILKAGNHQEIARSCYYDSKEEMLVAYGVVTGDKSNIGFGSALVGGTMMSAFDLAEQNRIEEATRNIALRTDDYLSCEAYEGAAGFYKFYNEESKEYYFAYNDENGKTLLRSEGYTTEKARDNGIESVKKNAPLEERWSKATALKGRYHYYILKAGNHQEIARSCYYEEEALMLAAFGTVTGEKSNIGYGSALVGGTMMSALALATRKKEQEEAAAEKVRLAAAAERKAEEERKAALAAAALAAKKKEEEAAALAAEKARMAAEEKRKAEEDKKKKAAAAAAAATAAAAALAAKKKEAAAALAAEQKRKAEEEEKAKAAALATAATAAAATRRAEEEKAAAAARGGGFKWWWLLPLLLLLLLLFLLLRGCGGEETARTAVIDDTEIETSIDETATGGVATTGEEAEGSDGATGSVVETDEEETSGVAGAESDTGGTDGTETDTDTDASATTDDANQAGGALSTDCNCSNKDAAIFQFEGTARSVDRLGTLPEFGNSHDLTPTQFFEKLQNRYDNDTVDRAYLNYVFRAMGYSNGFENANAGLFSAVTLTRGTKGNLGFGSYHGYEYHILNTSERDLMAFKIKANNGCDIHFMKTCGNYFYFCD
ncbi:MAG: DUF1508 domain-containing protein [Bacteroidota bacterium]